MSDAVFDAVVVGSGAGGAPVACRLAEAGLKVLVLERGIAWTRDQFGRDEITWVRRDRFVPSPRTDPHTLRTDEGQKANPTTEGWISTVLGGGTVHMGAYLLRGSVDDFAQGTRVAKNTADTAHSAQDWPVPHKALEPFYAMAERELGVSGSPASGLLPLNAHSLAARADKACAELGMESIPTPRGILTVGRPEEDRLPCAYRQQCASFGCPNDAKASMPATYLRRAEKTGNLTVWTATKAVRILRDPATKRATGVVIRRMETGAEETVNAGVVVVACGALESARLLLLSGEGFNPHGQVGRNLWFSLHSEQVGFFDKDKNADIPDLMTGSPFLNRSVRPDGRLPPEVQKEVGVDRTGMYEVSFVHDNPVHRAERLARQPGGKLLWGQALKRELQRGFRQGRFVILEGFGEMLPHPGCYTDLDPTTKDPHGLPVARMTVWHHPRDRRIHKQLNKDGEALLKAMGASEVRSTRGLGVTWVLQGGTARMGKDPQVSVTTPAGHLHDTPNVYVTDGGALPSGMTVPITLTIVANALRIAAGIPKKV
jgi:choline dehydrogenase-like flavoprotein